MTLPVADVLGFRELLRRRFGLDYDDSKLEQLHDVLEQRLRQNALSGFAAYAQALERDGAGELQILAEQLTIGETYFFRYWDHFRAVGERVLPELCHAQRAIHSLRILSAGTSSGEEAYSLAILVREAQPDLRSWRIEILGIDLNPAAIRKANEARFSAWSLRSTPANFERYFRRSGSTFVLDESIQGSVAFAEGNLVEPGASFWHTGPFDLIFCRNVLMYFAPEVAREIVARFARCLQPHGYLFLGHAETLRGLSSDFQLCHTHDTFYYSPANGESANVARHDADVAVRSTALQHDASWVETIQAASERIAALTSTPALRGGVAAGPDNASGAATAAELARAVRMLEEERFGDALAVLAALPCSAGADPQALLLRAVLLTNAGRLPEAERACQQLLELDQLSAGAHYLMALCREHAGDYQSALEHDQTAAYLDRGFSMPHVHMGLLAARTGNHEEARRELQDALGLLAREDTTRILFYGGGFRREALIELCRAKLEARERRP